MAKGRDETLGYPKNSSGNPVGGFKALDVSSLLKLG